MYTIQLCTMSHHFMQSHICRMHACLAVTCHLHFWQNNGDLLFATEVTPCMNSCRCSDNLHLKQILFLNISSPVAKIKHARMHTRTHTRIHTHTLLNNSFIAGEAPSRHNFTHTFIPQTLDMVHADSQITSCNTCHPLPSPAQWYHPKAEHQTYCPKTEMCHIHVENKSVGTQE